MKLYLVQTKLKLSETQLIYLLNNFSKPYTRPLTTDIYHVRCQNTDDSVLRAELPTSRLERLFMGTCGINEFIRAFRLLKICSNCGKTKEKRFMKPRN